MNPSIDPFRRRGATTAIVTFLLALLAPPRVLVAVAEQASSQDPGVVVSRDGSTYPSAPVSGLTSLPFPGTGVLPEGMHAAYAPLRSDLRPMEVSHTESVIGTDERHQVTDTTQFPHRAIVWLEITYPDSGGWVCTGFFIDADTIATAGHCVYSHDEGGWATAITAWPGRNGAAAPYGSAAATNVFSVSGWVTDHDHRFDYGAIKINSALGNTTGWLGYGTKLDVNLARANIRIFGYPADKPAATMWGTRRRIKGIADEKLFYKIDTYGGQSGSPVYGKLSNACQPCAFGIHAYGLGIEPYPESNSGTRVTATVFANLAYWATQ